MSGSEEMKLMELEFTEDEWVTRLIANVHKRA